MSDLQVDMIARAIWPDQRDGFQFTVEHIITEIRKQRERIAELEEEMIRRNVEVADSIAACGAVVMAKDGHIRTLREALINQGCVEDPEPDDHCLGCAALEATKEIR